MTEQGQTENTTADAAEKTVTKAQSMLILGASVMAAVSAFAATVIAQRSLSGVQLTEFLLFWSLIFGAFGIVAGIQQETTRAVAAARLDQKAGPPGARILPVCLAIGAGIALLLVVLAPGWGAAPERFGDKALFVALLSAVGVFLYAGHSAMSGASAGLQNWTLFAFLGGGEALWRLVAMLAVAFTVGHLAGFELAVVSTVLLWVLLAFTTKGGRAALAARGDVPAGRLSRNILLAMGSSTASAVLMMAMPLFLADAFEGDLNEHTTLVMGALILAVSITRSPIMIPLQAFQGVAIAAFLKQRHRPVAAMAKPAGALLGVGALGAALAWLIGPWLFLLIYRPEASAEAAYSEVAQGWVLGLLTFGSAVLALLVLSGTAVLALNAHRLYIAGWVVAAVTTVGLLFVLPFDMIPRTMTALYAGPALGFGLHMAGIVALARK